jgi:HB1, ASXL, restriction endonuclease HTH domain
MSEQPNAYAAVIADLKRKREKIDRAIKALEELSGGASSEAGVTALGADNTAPTEGVFLGMSIPDATKKLLQMRKKALGNNEIVRELEAGGLVLTSGNKTNTVGSVLNRRSKQVGDIVSISRGTWGLKEWYPNRRFDKKGVDENSNGNESNESSQSAVMNESTDSTEPEQP